MFRYFSKSQVIVAGVLFWFATMNQFYRFPLPVAIFFQMFNLVGLTLLLIVVVALPVFILWRRITKSSVTLKGWLQAFMKAHSTTAILGFTYLLRGLCFIFEIQAFLRVAEA